MLDGFLVIDKPVGLTSHDVVARLRRFLGFKKIGHTGTLDPFATGVLPIALGEATKAIQFLDESVKEYQAVMRIGIATDTQDLTGKTLSEADWSLITEEKIREVFASFTGEMTQIPPMYSALKSAGTPLYKLARRGETVERQGRLIEISSLSIDRINLPDISFTIRCSRGTYVRTVASDIGDQLATGAHLRSLRRMSSGSFTLVDSVSLDMFTSLAADRVVDFIIPVSSTLVHLPELQLTPCGALHAKNGKALLVDDFLSSPVALSAGKRTRLMLDGELVAISEGGREEDLGKGRFLKTVRVFNLLSPLQ